MIDAATLAVRSRDRKPSRSHTDGHISAGCWITGNTLPRLSVFHCFHPCFVISLNVF